MAKKQNGWACITVVYIIHVTRSRNMMRGPQPKPYILEPTKAACFVEETKGERVMYSCNGCNEEMCSEEGDVK